MKAFLLAAGLGIRLRPLSLESPKPAWPFFDVPLAAHVLRLLMAAGITEVVVNLHHLPQRVREALAPWAPGAIPVRWSFEQTVLGTGGALLPWRDFFYDGPFFLANADTYQEIDLVQMARFHQERGGDRHRGRSASAPRVPRPHRT